MIVYAKERYTEIENAFGPTLKIELAEPHNQSSNTRMDKQTEQKISRAGCHSASIWKYMPKGLDGKKNTNTVEILIIL